jgi:AcrR family transcriptional regulator
VTFQRARSEEQRTERRRVILRTAAAMLTEMPVSQLSLNELSRRVGLAKSNVLRYFESREAVLLELLNAELTAWLEELDGTLVTDATDPYDRGDQLAAILTSSLVARPVLCDLLSSQAAVLERNVSLDVAATFKRSTLGSVATLVGLVRRCLPELSEFDAFRAAGGALMMTAATWPNACPSAAMLAVYEKHPELATLRLDFADTLRQLLEVLVSGLLARANR